MEYNDRKSALVTLLTDVKQAASTRWAAAHYRAAAARDSGDDSKANAESARAAKFENVRQLSSLLARHMCWDTPFIHALAMAQTDPRQISYPRIDATPDTELTDAGRQRSKWHRFLTQILPARVLDAQPAHLFATSLAVYVSRTDYNAAAELMSELIGELATTREGYEINLVPVGGVRDMYNDDSIHSCMIEKEYVRWYDENPGVVRGVEVRLDGTRVARALLWLDVRRHNNESVEILDRIYPSNDTSDVTRALQRWANERGVYTYRETNDLNGSFVKDEIYTVTMGARCRSEFPYMDSFKFTDDDPSEETVLVMNTNGGTFTFDNIDGEWSGESEPEYEYCCDDCDDGINESYNVYGSYDRDSSRAVCESCRDNYTRIDQASERWWIGEYLHDDYVTRCDSSYDYAPSEDCVRLHDDDTVFCELAVEMSDGEYALKGDVITLENDDVVLESDASQDSKGDWYLADELIHLIDGTIVHQDLATELVDGTFVLTEVEQEMVA